MANNISRMPNRSPSVVSKTYIGGRTQSIPAPRGGGFTTIKISPDKPANANVTRTAREAAIRAKYPTGKGVKIISGKYAYGPKAPSAGKIAGKIAGKVAGTVARGALRAAGPVGALVGMTEPAGLGSDKKPKGIKGMSLREQSAANKATSAKRPTSSALNAPARTSPSGSARPTSNSLSAPARTAPSIGGSKTTGSTGPSRGPTSAPSRTAPSKSTTSSATRSTGPSRGPTSAPSRTAPSKANLGTSRF